MAVVPPRRALWDLEHLASLSTAPGLLLIVSERTLYVLHNLAALDIHNHYRYALQPPENGIYSPLTDEESAEWALYREVAEDAQTQIVEVGRMPIYGIEQAFGSIDTYPVPGAGSYDRSFGPVPAGEMWEIQALDAVCVGSNPSVINFRFISEWTTLTIQTAASPGNGINVLWAGRIVVSAGHLVTFNYQGVGAGSTLYSRIWFVRLLGE